MMTHYNKSTKTAVRGPHTPVESTTSVGNNKEANDRRHIVNDDTSIKKDSARLIDNMHLFMDPGETLDLTQLDVAISDSGNVKDGAMRNNRRVVESFSQEPNSILINIANNAPAESGPILGYAQEPLLPLSKACAPLTDIVHNISFYVQMALQETSEQPPDGLTVDESAAIRLYTIEWEGPHRSLYSMLNHTLKKDDRERLRPYFKYMKLFLTAIVKLPCVPPLTVWRGVTKDMSTEFLPSASVTWWGFSSCTTELTVLENNIYLGNSGNRTLFSIEAINVRTIRNHSHFAVEDEILLLPGTQMVVKSQFSPAHDLHVIHLKQIIPKEILLEPPFAGIFISFSRLFYIYTLCTFRCTYLSTKSVSVICFFLGDMIAERFHPFYKISLVSKEEIHYSAVFIVYTFYWRNRYRLCSRNQSEEQRSR